MKNEVEKMCVEVKNIRNLIEKAINGDKNADQVIFTMFGSFTPDGLRGLYRGMDCFLGAINRLKWNFEGK